MSVYQNESREARRGDTGVEARMRRIWVVVLLSVSLPCGNAPSALAQAGPTPARPEAGAVRYDRLADGVHEARLFATEALASVRIEVTDVILGPERSAPSIAVDGFRVTELKSGEVETTIDGQATRRRPGDFWVVRPGQTYTIKNLGGMVVLHVITFVRK
jgi:hypothetical protein